MKLSKLTKFIIPALAIIIFMVPVVTFAQEGSSSAFEKILGMSGIPEVVGSIISSIMSIGLSIASWLLALAGTLLNVSLLVTMHIKDFVDSTPAIYEVWKVIRDLSGIFIIFFLLYSSIQLILGIEPPNFGKLIKNIVIAGVLINFSFFFVSLAIDFSNVVSLTIYRSITPGNPNIAQIDQKQGTSWAILTDMVSSTSRDGGISAIFMQRLKPQSVYSIKGNKLANNDGNILTTYLKVIISQWTGIIIMLTAALSFLGAALAFIARLFILIMLLAFSPIWFAAAIIPELGEYAKKWWGQLFAQLTFMPVYMLLMYAAILILSKSKFFTTPASGDLWSGSTFTGLPTEFIALFINAVFVIVMLNVPLIAAIKTGGVATGWLEKKGWGAGAMWKRINGLTLGRAAGNLASRADKALGNTKIGNSLIMRDLRGATTGAIINSKMGTGRSYKELQEANKDVAKKNKEIDRRRDFDALLTDKSLKPDVRLVKTRELLAKMSKDEKVKLGKDKLTDRNIVKALSKEDFEAIEKSEMSDEDKEKIRKIRMDSIKESAANSLTGTDKESLDFMINNLDNKNLIELIDYDKNIILNQNTIKNLTISQLKYIKDNGKLSGNDLRVIANTIINQHNNPSINKTHQAAGYINNNLNDWR